MSEENLSILSLILDASLLVQLVMAILFIASVISWIMIVQRGIYLRNAEREFKIFEDTFWSGVDLNNLYRELSESAQENGGGHGIENVFRAGFREFTRLTQGDGADPDAVMEGTDRAMRVALSREEEKLSANLPFLASVASVSPYIGLFNRVGNNEFISWSCNGSAGHPCHRGAGYLKLLLLRQWDCLPLFQLFWHTIDMPPK